MSLSNPDSDDDNNNNNNNNRNEGGGGGGFSSLSQADDQPIPPFQPFSVSELDHDEAAGNSSSSFVYNYNSPHSHFVTTIAADFGCFSSFFDSQLSSTTTAPTTSSFTDYLPSLDQFGPLPSPSPHVFHAPHSCPLPEASGKLPPDGGDGAAATPPTAPPPLSSPPADVVCLTPLSEVQEVGADVGPATVLASPAPVPAPSEIETTQPSSAVSEVVPEVAAASDGATVAAAPPPPLPPSNEAVAIPSSLPIKRKRGRPRKIFPEASSSAEQGRRAPAPAPAEAAPQTQVQGAAEASCKRKSDKQGIASSSKGKMEASPSILINKTSKSWGLGSKRNVIQPAVIIVPEKEDVSERIMSFARENGAVFILAASGILSYVELLQPPESAVSSFTGKFDILTLSGSLLMSKDGQSKSGYLTVSMTQVDGRVAGGRVHGRLIAASPIQIIGGIVAPADKRTSKPLEFQADQILQLNKQISCMNQEWQARLDEQKREVVEANKRLETTTKELNETKQQLNETKQQLNETKQQLNETRQQVATTQNMVKQLIERLNIVNPSSKPPTV